MIPTSHFERCYFCKLERMINTGKTESTNRDTSMYICTSPHLQNHSAKMEYILFPVSPLQVTTHWQHWYLCDTLNSNRSLEDKQKNLKLCAHRQRVLYFQKHLKCSLTHKLSSYKHLVIPNTDCYKFYNCQINITF